MKYLIVKCDELSDQFECDANRTPVCLTDNYSKYGLGYEIYEILPDNTFKKIKDYDDAREEGMALYFWGEDEDDNDMPTVMLRYKNMKQEKIKKSVLQRVKEKAKFTATIEEIRANIARESAHGEEINGNWVVFGVYQDHHFVMGY